MGTTKKIWKKFCGSQSFSPPKAEDAAGLARCRYHETLACLSPALLGEACSAPALCMWAGDLPKRSLFLPFCFHISVAQFLRIVIHVWFGWYRNTLPALVEGLSCVDAVALFIYKEVGEHLTVTFQFQCQDTSWETRLLLSSHKANHF